VSIASNNRTLVIVFGQLRGHELTWANFRRNVLDELDVDLAACVPNDPHFDIGNPYYRNARFRWLVPDVPDLAVLFDSIQRVLGSTEDWRVVCEIGGTWLGRVAQAKQEGAGAIHFILRWFMLDNIRAAGLLERYDRFVLTRSDFYYLCPHPPLEYLDAGYLWIPDGEDWSGLCDRHLVVSPRDLAATCNAIEDLLRAPGETLELMRLCAHWNTEGFIALHYRRNGLIARTRRFPYVMFLVRGENDPMGWSGGSHDPGVGMTVKYPSEFREAARFGSFVKSRADWRSYFVALSTPDRVPARVYTNLGTVVFVDEASFRLRHGPIDAAPANLFFVQQGASGFLVHRTQEGTARPLRFGSPGEAAEVPDANHDPTRFEMVPVPEGRPDINPATNFVGLRHAGLFLSAEPAGQLPMVSPELRYWECFRRIPAIGHVRIRAGAERR
jgi:hypothetical protein